MLSKFNIILKLAKPSLRSTQRISFYNFADFRQSNFGSPQHDFQTSTPTNFQTSGQDMRTSSTERDVGGLSKNASQREHIHDAQCGPECQADKMKFQNSAAEKKDQQKSPQYGENKRDIGQCYTGTETDKSTGLGKSKEQQKSPQYGENKIDIGQCYTGTETDKATGLDKSKDQQKSPQYGENKRDIGQCYTGTEADKATGLGKSKGQQKSPQYGENKRDIGQCYTGTEAIGLDKSKENLEKEFEKKSDDAYAKDTQRGSQRSTARNQ